MSRPFFTAHGFTLLELMIVLSLGIILATATYLMSITTIRGHEFQRTREAVNRELWHARTDTIANTNDGSWGVRFFANTMTRYRGNSYANRQTGDDVVHTFESYITFSETNDVTFLRPEGTVSSTHTISFTDSVRSATTTIYPSGAILTP